MRNEIVEIPMPQEAQRLRALAVAPIGPCYAQHQRRASAIVPEPNHGIDQALIWAAELGEALGDHRVAPLPFEAQAVRTRKRKPAYECFVRNSALEDALHP